MSESQEKGGAAGEQSNQERLRDLLKDGSLAKHLACDYDESDSEEMNRSALKKVVEARLEEVRSEHEEGTNQVD